MSIQWWTQNLTFAGANLNAKLTRPKILKQHNRNIEINNEATFKN